MRSAGFLIVLILLLGNCTGAGEKALSVNEYFSLDSLLDAQIEWIAASDVVLAKSVTLDDRTEKESMKPDTATLKDEFRIFREFDLNKTNYVGAFDKVINDSLILYDLKNGQSSPVKFLRITRDKNGLDQITGHFFEDKEIFRHVRDIRIIFSEGRITSYSIRGFQDMIMKDTVFFQTEVMIK